jgi:hypothetical protein
MQIIAKSSVTSVVNILLTIYYFKVLKSKVIVCRDELCASNDEDGIVQGKAPFPPVGHGSHAAAAGTKVRLADSIRTMGRVAAKFAAPDSRQRPPVATTKDLRQGIASRRGHVAPALLLC